MFSALRGRRLREAQLIAEHLVEANLRGHDSHGVGVVPMYINGVRSGGMVMNQSLKVAVDTGAMLICDAGQGAGQVMAHDAMALGIARARDEGSAIVSLRNSHHIGRIGHWAEQCAAAGMVSIHFVNVVAGAIVAPFGGTQSRLGTNPFAAAFPRDGAPPVVVDFATSKLAAGKVRVAHQQGRRAAARRAARQPGQADDRSRRAVRNAAGIADDVRRAQGLGADAGLRTARRGDGRCADAASEGRQWRSDQLDVLGDRLAGAAWDGGAVRGGAGVGARLGAVGERGGGSVKLPGMPELETKAKRSAEGIPIDAATLDQLEAAARDVGLKGFEAA